MNIAITKVKDDEILALALMAYEVWNEYYTSTLSQEQIKYMLHKFQSAKSIEAQIKNEGYEYFFLTNEDNQKIGYLGIKKEDKRLFISKVYFLKIFRGQGFGRLAFQYAHDKCKEYGLKATYLTVNKHNSASIAVYKKFGYETIDEVETDIGDGYVMDDYIMEKKL